MTPVVLVLLLLSLTCVSSVSPAGLALFPHVIQVLKGLETLVIDQQLKNVHHNPEENVP